MRAGRRRTTARPLAPSRCGSMKAPAVRSYPITARRARYRGADPKKRAKAARYNQVAARVEAYLNDDLAKLPDDTIRVYMSYQVAAAIGEDSRIVRDIILATDGGSGGITVLKGDFERAMARRG